jgi:hypothetical protein
MKIKPHHYSENKITGAIVRHSNNLITEYIKSKNFINENNRNVFKINLN